MKGTKLFTQFITRVAMYACLVGAVIAFQSCSLLEDEIETVYYTMGFSTISSSSLELLDELNLVDGAFRTALGVEDNQFSIEGILEECDIVVLEACEKASVLLEGLEFETTFVYVVTNDNTAEIIYSYEYRNSPL